MKLQRRLRLAMNLAYRLEDHLRADDEAAARLELRALRDRMKEANQQLAALVERLDPHVRMPVLLEPVAPSPPAFGMKRKRFNISGEAA